MSFPPPLPNNPMFQAAFAQAAVPPLPRFQIPIGSLPVSLMQPGSLPMGVTVPAGVATISAPPVRNQSAVIAAPPLMSVGNPLIFQQQSALLQKAQTDAAKKVEMTTVFVGNITDRASDMLIRQLLTKCGSVHNWKRIQGPDGKLQAFGFCDYSDQESAMRAIRLLHDFEIADKKLIVRVDAKTQEKLNEYRKNMNSDRNDIDEQMKDDDKFIKSQLLTVLKEHEIELSRDPDPKIIKRYTAPKDTKPENLSELDMEDEKRLLIHREIDKFRDTYKKYDEEKEEEKRKKDDRSRKSDRRNDFKRSRSRERPGRSRDKDRDKRSNRERRSSSSDDDLERNRSESPVDEEELLLKRRQEKQLREKEHSYQRRLRDWEAREKRKLKEHERERQKEERRKEEEEIEKQKLKQFLQDYDDEKHDPKYYKGRLFQRRLMDRQKEIEQDEYEREQERKELEELRQRLAREGHPDPESEVRKMLNVDTANDFDDRIKLLMSEARNNAAIFNDEDSRDSASNSGAAIKTFGFAGMKIGGASILDSSHNGAGSTAPNADVSNEHSNSSLQLNNSEVRPKRLTVSEVFNSNEDDDALAQNGKKRRPPPNALFEDSNTDSNLSAGSNKAGTSQLSQEEKRRQIKNLIDKIPTSKNELFNYNFDWDLLDNNLMERRIRPWINKKISDYIGEEEQTLLDFICKKLLSKSSAQSLLDDVAMVLDDEAQIFVVKLWRLLIYEIEAKKLGINKA